MMTIQQIVDIPADRKVRFDVVLPETVPCGRAEVVLNFSSIALQGEDSEQETSQGLSPLLEKIMEEAEQKRLYWASHPEELKQMLDRVRKGPPLFGGIGADEFKRRNNDEWEDRF
jgi:hypothetical protein